MIEKITNMILNPYFKSNYFVIILGNDVTHGRYTTLHRFIDY